MGRGGLWDGPDGWPVIPGPAATNRGNDATLVSAGDQSVGVAVHNWRPGLVTVALGVEPSGTDGADAHGELVAVLTWGAGGVSQRAETDFAQGTHVVLAAETVDVHARWDAVDGSTWTGARLSALIVPGVHPGLRSPTRTRGPLTLAAGAATTVLVPAWAFGLWFKTTSPGLAGSLVVEELGGTGAAPRVLAVTDGATLSGLGAALAGGQRLRPGALAVRVTNTAGVAITFDLVFGLDL